MVEDLVFVATMTKNGGSFTMTSGGNAPVTEQASAGVQIFKIPMGVGEQKFSFTANANGASGSDTSSIPISAECWVSQSRARGSVKRGEVWADTSERRLQLQLPLWVYQALILFERGVDVSISVLRLGQCSARPRAEGLRRVGLCLDFHFSFSFLLSPLLCPACFLLWTLHLSLSVL